MCQAHEFPFGQAFRKCKLDAHFAIGIRAEVRIEKGRFSKIGANLR